ncbi:MAG: tetratricopeptide repeat protein [Nitrosopumilaceae archaeon]
MQIEQINPLYYEGNELSSSERFDEAVKCYDEIIRMNPNSRVAWGYKAHALSKLKKYDEAFACYQKALKC